MPILRTRGRRGHASHVWALGKLKLARDKENASVGEDDAKS